MSSFHFIHDPEQARNTFLLNGRWQITGGDENTLPSHYPSTVPVPALVDMSAPAYDWQGSEFHYYRTTFRIAQLPSANALFLKIGMAMFGTSVWVNGTFAGSSISCYTSQKYRIDPFLRRDGENELVIRVGQRSTLPPESAVGRDQEREVYIPGIWGDVTLFSAGDVSAELVQVIPHLATATAEVRVWLGTLSELHASAEVSAQIFRRADRMVASPMLEHVIPLRGQTDLQTVFPLPIENCEWWSPQTPVLYEAVITVRINGKPTDTLRTTFGMREFRVNGANFELNGQRILLRGGNIAFHRFLSDRQRGLLPWDEQWIKKALIDIPKEHHFNFFRNHLGQMYHRWYDIADEHGMLLQNEWQFWGVTGTDAQIRKEFTEWLHDNWNHPSIVMWDPINESTDETMQHQIVPAMKKLDPTRPWESADFLEEHPYIYSLGMVLNNRTFGFARSLDTIEHLTRPSMLNEFLWWWFNDEWQPTVLTKMIVERWMGRNYTKDDIIAHQSFLALELIELFRRMRVKAIQPFVYLSNNDGPTAHWFLGHIKDLQPKPLLGAIKNAFAPLGVSVELWDRHFFVKKEHTVRYFVFNDSPEKRTTVVRFGLLTSDRQWIQKEERVVTLEPVSDAVLTGHFFLPNGLDSWSVCAQIVENGEDGPISKKRVHAHFPPHVSLDVEPFVLFDPSGEIGEYCSAAGLSFLPFSEWNGEPVPVIVLHGNVLGSRMLAKKRALLTEFVRNGGTLVIMEPEFRTIGTVTHSVMDGVDVTITQRPDPDKGGYDSYVFMEDPEHPVWQNIRPEHLKLFNGAYGGEIVSQYDVTLSIPEQRLASCGMDLAVAALSEYSVGKGKIILNRLQVRGRLLPGTDESFYARREDPVAQHLFVNLIHYSMKHHPNKK